MEAFIVATCFGKILYGPFAHYGDAEVAAKHAEPGPGHPLRVEKHFFCYQGNGEFCPECVRVLRERGEKAEAGMNMASKLGVSFKLHA